MTVTPIKRGGLNWIIHLTIRARWDVQVPRVSLVQLARKETEDFRVHPEIVEYKDHRSVIREFLILITMKPRNDILSKWTECIRHFLYIQNFYINIPINNNNILLNYSGQPRCFRPSGTSRRSWSSGKFLELPNIEWSIICSLKIWSLSRHSIDRVKQVLWDPQEYPENRDW